MAGESASARKKTAQMYLRGVLMDGMAFMRTMERRDDFSNGASLPVILKERIDRIGSRDSKDQFVAGVRTEISSLIMLRDQVLAAIDTLEEMLRGGG